LFSDWLITRQQVNSDVSHWTMLYDNCFRPHDYVENDVDIDVPLTTDPPKTQQQDSREFRPQLLGKSGFLFPLRQVKAGKCL
jgi:hypothetical protein